MPVGKTRIVKIVDYDAQWPVTFAALKRIIENALGDSHLSVEHVGSTSVPGLAAKPVIDLDVVIESNTRLPDVIRSLASLGYLYRGDLGVTGREAFDRGNHDVPRDGTGRTWSHHHLYVCAQDSIELKRHLDFRDYLRQNTHEASAYETLKRHLAQQHRHDIDSYIEGKTTFIEKILRRTMGPR